MNISDMKSTNQLKKRNQITVTGTHQKTLKSSVGQVEIDIRGTGMQNSEPKIVPRYKRDISEIENKI